MKIAVIGGGAAGMMAALSAKRANPGAEVLLLEKNEKLGKKIFISGKGRGNLTNSADIGDFPQHFFRNPRFLYSAFSAFSNRDLWRLVEENGCPLKEERGGRVFPLSDHAFSITDALKRALKKAGVKLLYRTEAREIRLRNGAAYSVCCREGEISADRLIVATGGLSYPSTGSTGDGYRFAGETGHRLRECLPSLVPLLVEEGDCRFLQGLKLRNAGLSIRDEEGRSYYESFGEIDFLPDALSGPIILSASAELTELLHSEEAKRGLLLTAHIDLKPALTEKMLEGRLIRELENAGGGGLERVLSALLPLRFLPVFLRRLEKRGISRREKAGELSREKRREIETLLRDFCFTIRGTASFREAIITRGGVDTRDISPKSMESRRVRGLYFAGELLDIDASTGGYNMQAAFSTGFLAGRSAAEER